MAQATIETRGCPIAASHNQQPDIKSDDPIEHLNAGNFSKAIDLYALRDEQGTASAEDYALGAHAYRNVGEFAVAADWLQKAAEKEPEHIFAKSWKDQAEANRVDGQNGAGVLRANNLTEEYLRADPAQTYEGHSANWVLCTDFQRPGDFIPPKSIGDRLRNFKDSLVSLALGPVGALAHPAMQDAGRSVE